MQQERLITERLDRLENHFKVYKTDVSDIKDELKEVRMLLGGSTLNCNKGFIRLMEAVETKVDKLEVDIQEIKHDVSSAKFWGRGATGVAFVTIGLMIKKLLEL